VAISVYSLCTSISLLPRDLIYPGKGEDDSKMDAEMNSNQHATRQSGNQ
jgi:hypothetical protein